MHTISLVIFSEPKINVQYLMSKQNPCLCILKKIIGTSAFNWFSRQNKDVVWNGSFSLVENQIQFWTLKLNDACLSAMVVWFYRIPRFYPSHLTISKPSIELATRSVASKSSFVHLIHSKMYLDKFIVTWLVGFRTRGPLLFDKMGR